MTILFADIVNFTVLASQIKTKELIYILNEIFGKYDALSDKHGIFKVETIGDCYMAAAGHDGGYIATFCVCVCVSLCCLVHV